MGLPSFTLNDELAARWRAVLEENGMTVCCDEAEAAKHKDEPVVKRISEAPWLVSEGGADLRVLEVTFHDCEDGKFCLVVMPTSTPAERQLFFRVKEVLVASGAVAG